MRLFEESPVYVGTMEFPYGRMIMFHMASPNVEALHEMADRIGINRKWFQNDYGKYPHYDICKAKKKLAIKLGAHEVNDRVLIMECTIWKHHPKQQEKQSES